jgi:peptide/nickel transport system permease protein
MAWLLSQRVGQFLAVLFLSSLVLTLLLWASPASPGKPRASIEFSSASLGDPACFDRSTCGVLASMPEGTPPTVAIDVDGQRVVQPARFAKQPGPGLFDWFVVGFWGGLLTGDVGESKAFLEPALDVVLRGAPYTLGLVLAALCVAVVLALVLTALLAWLPFPSLRGAIRAGLLIASITPVFILGYMLQTQGILPFEINTTVLAACVAILFLGDGNLAEILLGLEDEVRKLRSRDYIHAANLRGASLWLHMLPGLLLPITSISAAKVAFLLGSVVIAERLYRIPGLGEASLEAAKEGDVLLLLTLTVFITGVVALVALVRDVAEIAIDPRLRRGREDGG